MKENGNLYQCIQIKWPYFAKLQICRYSHINFHKHLTSTTRSFLQCKSKASIFWEWGAQVLPPSEMYFHHFVLPAQIYLKIVFSKPKHITGKFSERCNQKSKSFSRVSSWIWMDYSSPGSLKSFGLKVGWQDSKLDFKNVNPQRNCI